MFKLRSLLKPVRSSHTSRRRAVEWSAATEQLEARALLTAHLGFIAGFEGGAFEITQGLASDETGSVYSVGSFAGTTDFDPGSGEHLLTSAGPALESDAFISKLGSSGEFVAAGQFTSSGEVEAAHVAVDPSGNVLIAGHFDTETDFDPGPAVSLLNGKSGDAFLVKLDADLNLLWARRFGGGGAMTVAGLGLDKSGNPFLAGHFSKTIDFDPGPGYSKLTAGGKTDSYVMKLDTSGELKRVAQFVGTTCDKSGITDLAVDGGGNAYVTGYFAGTVDFDPKADTTLLTSEGGRDVFVTKLDRGGRLTWVRHVGAGNRDEAQAITIDPQTKDVYFASTHIGLIDSDPGPGVDNHKTVSNDVSSGHETFITRLTRGGSHEWTKRFAETRGQLQISGLDVRNSQLYATGQLTGRIDFDHSETEETRRSRQGTSAFVARYDNDGGFAWAEAGGQGETTAVHVSAAGAVYAGGQTQGGDFDPGPDQADPGAGAFVWQLQQIFEYTIPSATENLVVRRNDEVVELFDSDKDEVLATANLTNTAGLRLDGTRPANLNVTIDHGFGGTFDFDQGVELNSGSGENDSLSVINGTDLSAEYRPVTGTPDESRLLVDAATDVMFTGVELVELSGLHAAALRTNGMKDTLEATGIKGIGGGAFAMQIAGSADTAIPALRVYDTLNVMLETRGGNDEVSFDQKSLKARGLQNLSIDTGAGRDTVSIVAQDLSLDQPDARVEFASGAGPDTLSIRGNTDYEINSNRVISATGGSVFFSDLETAELTGGAGDNRLNGRLFDSQLILNGLGGSDTLIGGTGDDILNGGTGNDELKGRNGNDLLRGGAGSDILMGLSGNDIVQGGGGDDQLLGHDGNDSLSGGAGADELFGGAGNDALSGDDGADMLFVDASDDANQLDVRLIAAQTVAIFQMPPGRSTQVERDVVDTDDTDELFIQLLGGDDIIDVADNVGVDGTVDGGAGADQCVAPSGWDSLRC